MNDLISDLRWAANHVASQTLLIRGNLRQAYRFELQGLGEDKKDFEDEINSLKSKIDTHFYELSQDGKESDHTRAGKSLYSEMKEY